MLLTSRGCVKNRDFRKRDYDFPLSLTSRRPRFFLEAVFRFSPLGRPLPGPNPWAATSWANNPNSAKTLASCLAETSVGKDP